MVTETLNIMPVINITGTVRREQYRGRDTLIAPVILMVEGVHNGSAGPLYYPANELRASTIFWNGMPLPIDHPTNDQGMPISCNSPDVLANRSVGRLFHVVFEEQPVPRLKGEIYVDVQRANEVSPLALAKLNTGRPLEVSTGLFSVDEMVAGKWNEEDYIGIVRNIRPDHLALLPNSTGACSWTDGCGVRANKGGEPMASEKEGMNILQKFMAMFKGDNHLTENEASFEDVRRALQTVMDAKDNDTQVHYVHAVFSDHFIYRVETRQGGAKFFKCAYMLENGVAKIGENPQEVRPEVEYEPVNSEEQQKTNESAKEEVSMDRKEKVTAMIANGIFQETDREFLEKCECSNFAKLEILSASTVASMKDEELLAECKKRNIATNEAAKPVTFEEMMAVAPEDVKARFTQMEAKANEHRESVLARIKANTANKLSDATLAAMDIGTLEEVANSIPAPVANYAAGAGTVTPVATNDAAITEAPMAVPEIKFGK